MGILEVNKLSIRNKIWLKLFPLAKTLTRSSKQVHCVSPHHVWPITVMQTSTPNRPDVNEYAQSPRCKRVRPIAPM